MSNQKTGVRTNPILNMERFDALPKPIRHIVAHAPFDYNVNGFLKDWRDCQAIGMSIESFRQRTIELLCNDLQRHARKTYGPDHPDAMVSRLDRKRRAA